MPISPIELFRPAPLDGVGQILAGGTNILATALNNAVQIGRDHTSLRASQGKEFLAERERTENMDQRKAEFFTQQKNVDRNFIESVFRDRRDTAETNADDERNFGYKKEEDARDFALRSFSVGNNVALGNRSQDLQEKKFSLEEENTKQSKEFLKTRADDILKVTEPRNFIQRMFTPDPLPEDNLALGKELRDIGVTLRDPNLVSRADKLLSEGTRGMDEKKARIRATLPPSRAVGKTPISDEEKVIKLTRFIDAWKKVEAESMEADDKTLAQSAKAKVYEAESELQALQKKLGKAEAEPTKEETIVDQVKSKYFKKKP
jgi:hypothetical protein